MEHVIDRAAASLGSQKALPVRLRRRPGGREKTQRQATGQAYMEISRTLNALSGGTDYEAGFVSPSPEVIRYWFQVAGGGLLRETEKIINSTVDVARGNDVKPTGVPVFSRLYGEVDDEHVQTRRFYDNLRKIEKAEKRVKAAEDAGDYDRSIRIENQRPESLLGKDARKYRSEVREVQEDIMDTIGMPERLKTLDKERVEIMRDLNKEMAELDRPRREATPGGRIRQAMGLSDAR